MIDAAAPIGSGEVRYRHGRRGRRDMGALNRHLCNAPGRLVVEHYGMRRCALGEFQRSVHGSRHDAGAVTHPDRWRAQDARKSVVVARS